MRRIKNWQLFLEKRELDLLNESIIYFSPAFKDELTKIKHPIADHLLQYEEEEDKERDISFIDLHPDEGYVSFKTMKSMMSQIKDSDIAPDTKQSILDMENSPNYYWSERIYKDYPEIWNRSRNPIRLGSLIQKLFPGKFDANRQIEPFVTKFKSLQRGDSISIEIVKGKDIAYWYEEENYYERSGTLGNSCMKDVDRNYFDIYTKNPDVCKMACIFTEDEYGEKKLTGRALLWKVTTIEPAGRFNSVPQFEWLMDRQYSISDGITNDLKKWAEKNGYAYKTRNSFSSLTGVTFAGQEFDCKMTIQLDVFEFQKFPYLDTFRKFDPKTGILYNDEAKGKEFTGMYILDRTNGGFNLISTGKFSYYYGRHVSEEEAIYSEPLDDHIIKSRAVEVTKGSPENLGWFPEDHEDLVYDGWNKTYIVGNDAVRSKTLGYYILETEAVPVAKSILKLGQARNGDCWIDYFPKDDIMSYNKIEQYKENFWYKVLSGKFPNWRRVEGIHRDLIIGVYDIEGNGRRVSLYGFAVDLFQTEGESDFRWLDRTAADFLGVELGGKHKICCGLEYVNWLKEKLGAEWGQINEMLQKCENKDEYWDKFEMILNVLWF